MKETDEGPKCKPKGSMLEKSLSPVSGVNMRKRNMQNVLSNLLKSKSTDKDDEEALSHDVQAPPRKITVTAPLNLSLTGLDSGRKMYIPIRCNKRYMGYQNNYGGMNGVNSHEKSTNNEPLDLTIKKPSQLETTTSIKTETVPLYLSERNRSSPINYRLKREMESPRLPWRTDMDRPLDLSGRNTQVISTSSSPVMQSTPNGIYSTLHSIPNGPMGYQNVGYLPLSSIQSQLITWNRHYMEHMDKIQAGLHVSKHEYNPILQYQMQGQMPRQMTANLTQGMVDFTSPVMPYVPANLSPGGNQGRKPSTKCQPRVKSSGACINRTTIPKLEEIPALQARMTENEITPENVIAALKQMYPAAPASVRNVFYFRFAVDNNFEITVINKCLMLVCRIGAEEIELQGEKGYPFACRLCNSQFFHLDQLQKHVQKDHVEKKYVCPICGKSCHDKGNYRQHMRTHDDDDIPYECEYCNKRFRHKCTLKVHVKIHTGEKPFACEICNARFKIVSALNNHMRTHTGEKPYPCPQCELRFTCQSQLNQHILKHTQERPHECVKCGKRFSRKSSLTTHMNMTRCKNSEKNDNLPSIPRLSPELEESMAENSAISTFNKAEFSISPQKPESLAGLKEKGPSQTDRDDTK